ncbi:M16 family metallopeptidase [Dichotomicrobium thermohalophilum]|uniref:Zinc protease n=1 Tax=Dichotomicrobium thermohalophilum TaxID=933063 RepID=A0A397PFZ5_9HYPH|nr:pitrilysin family protein [Dichotomicrobium thermohalophilum]RIA47383.1 zinc protease [Dichotomicrobium thermohalophilum]
MDRTGSRMPRAFAARATRNSLLDRIGVSGFATLIAMGIAIMTISNAHAEDQPGASALELAGSAPQVASYTLDNGMNVVVIPDNRAPVVTHMVWYKVGAADEPPGHSGIAHFLEHLMFKGTEKLDPGEFSKMVARWGGQDNAFTSQDVTAYFQRIPKDRLGDVMKMEADRMVNLRLAEENVVTERDVILEERRMRVDNDPANILMEQAKAALYLAHPYGTPIIGWDTEIRQLDRRDALSFYERFYAPNNAVLVVSGDVAPEEVLELARKHYGDIARRDEVSRGSRPAEPEPRAPREVMLKDPRAAKPTLYRYYLAPSYAQDEGLEAEALELLMRIVGENPTGRLYQELVVKQKLATTAGGWFSGITRDYGSLGIYAVATPQTDIVDVEAALDRVISDVAENGVTEDELERARRAAIAELVYDYDSQTSMARIYGYALATGRSVEDIAKHPQRLAQVTMEDVAAAAEKYLQAERSVTAKLIPDPQAVAEDRQQTAQPPAGPTTTIQ